ncbi:TonB-dependent siderophore receptor [Ferrovibrio sp.]|uniref:TonB-dependent siderophore receptor n=1 Tax=Ferrovibrio sp. TaxID=1917215 RepID=UPI0025C47D5D|nr:TonB-dependent siderophore receptor [Ferrovibrio sp.]
MVLAGLLAGSAGLVLMAGQAQAQAQARARAQAQHDAHQQVAQAGQSSAKDFAIPAQSLVSALVRFTDATGIQFFFDAAIARDKRSQGVSGRLSAEEALRRMLVGSGLTFRFTNANTVTLVPVPEASGAAVLDPVTVQGQVGAEGGMEATAWSPAGSFVAKRSASGMKTDTPLAETPQSISVVTREEMQARNVTNIAEALGYTAGVRAGIMGSSSGYGGDSSSIRGFGGDGTSGPSFNEYIDGMRLRGAGYVVSGIDPFAFERVEVIKGPASVLYGQSTPGGLVNMVSKRPQAPGQAAQAAGEAEVQTGSNNRKQGSVDFGDKLNETGSLTYRLGVLAFDTEGQTAFSDRARISLAPSLTWSPHADTTLTILTRYQRDNFDGSALNWLPAAGTILPNANGKVSRDFFAGDPNFMRWDRTNIAFGYAFEQVLSDTFTARQNFRHMYNQLDYASVYISTMNANGRTANRQAFGMLEHSRDTTIDNQLQADFNTGPVKHTLLGGVDLQYTRSDTDRILQNTAATIDIFNPVYYQTFTPTAYQKNKTETNQYGLYLQDQIKWDQWILVLGLRQDWAQTGTRNMFTYGRTKQSDDALTKRAALMYRFDAGFSPYVSYTESFDPSVGSLLVGNIPAKPSEGVQYEMGVKYQPPGYNSFITASVFDLTRQNVTTNDLVNTGFVVQTGEISSRGLELEAKAALSEGLSGTLSYTYLDAEVTSFNGTVNTINGVAVQRQGKTPTRVPQNSASAWLDYTFKQGEWRGLGLGAGLRYVGETYGDDANSFKVPAFTLFDAAIRYDLANLGVQYAGWSAALTGSNLLDKEYVSACSAAVRCFYGDGRRVYASLKYKW